MIHLNKKLNNVENVRVTKASVEEFGYSLSLYNVKHKSIKSESSDGIQFAEIEVSKGETLIRKYKVVLWFHGGSETHYVSCSVSEYTRNKCNISKKDLYEFVLRNLKF